MTQKMLKQSSMEYEPKKTLNIADLEKVDLSWLTDNRTGEDKEGKPYNFKVMIVNGIDYRVPFTVLDEIKKMLDLKPDLKFVRVEKQGSGLSTRYNVKKVE